MLANGFVVGAHEQREPIVRHVRECGVPEGSPILERMLAPRRRVDLQHPLHPSAFSGSAEQRGPDHEPHPLCEQPPHVQLAVAHSPVDLLGRVLPIEPLCSSESSSNRVYSQSGGLQHAENSVDNDSTVRA